MATQLGVYKCEICGNIVEVLHAGGGELVCCGQPMKQLKENTVDAAKEKHVPVIERSAKGVLVKVGSVPHPMEEKHHIEWIEVVAGALTFHKFLRPGDKPEAFFSAIGGSASGGEIVTRAYCNLHGLWAAKS